MDPAGPAFENTDPASRLDATDAVLVDTIHTDGFELGLGYDVSDVDFYPNKGLSPQPPCEGGSKYNLLSYFILLCISRIVIHRIVQFQIYFYEHINCIHVLISCIRSWGTKPICHFPFGFSLILQTYRATIRGRVRVQRKNSKI